MKNKVILKIVHKDDGSMLEIPFKSFDLHDEVSKNKVLDTLKATMFRLFDSECIFQIETFNEHDVCELNIF